MSIQVPVRLKIEKNGAVIGYVETLDFAAGVSVSGPVAHITGSGGGGGDADTLQGHPASFFAVDTDLTAVEAQVAVLLDRAQMWSLLGVAVQASAPATGVTYAQWLAGAAGEWGWIQIP